ncbi:unnamed protein product [Cylindrotheca closterium]|uniref:Uncharacterized protein n=1 Tax=Cylindrotheca closterium TaxID=2856 RepID=A0AAD2FFW9_9STRA|nr:unnamed protein product [Cylindrotheca closterium]
MMKGVWNVLIIVLLLSKQTPGFDSQPRGRLGFLPGNSFALFEKPGRRERKIQEKREEYQLRKRLWLERYGTVEALQQTFGVAPPFGDLSPEQTRRLYHTLLPRSLLGLYEMGVMKPEELAPLAYNARIAAKEYARSRCVWTARLMTTAFDIYRGRLGKSSSMSWEELYKKYEAQIVEEECNSELNGNQSDDEDLTMRIYLRILEKSCSTNQAFDSMFLNEEEDDEDSGYLDSVATKLEDDVRYILLPPNERAKAKKVKRQMEKAEEKMAEKKTKIEKKELSRQKAVRKRLRQKRRLKAAEDSDHEIQHDKATTVKSTKKTVEDSNSMPSQRWTILRILAGTRRKDKKISKEKI